MKRTDEAPKPDTSTPAPTAPAAQPVALTLGSGDLQAIVGALVAEKLAAIMTAKTHDERVADALAQQRGKGNAPLPEFLVACRSPLTGATFTARLITSRTIGTRVVEMLDYERPRGWDRKVADGGLVPDGDQMPLKEADGRPGQRYAKWLYESFLMLDSNAIGGHPLPDYWRADRVPAVVAPPGSVVLTAEELAKLGIDAEQIKSALAASTETTAP